MPKVDLICFNTVHVKVRMKSFIKLTFFVFVFRLILITLGGRETRQDYIIVTNTDLGS